MVLTLVRNELGVARCSSTIMDLLLISPDQLRVVLLFLEYSYGNTLKIDSSNSLFSSIDLANIYDLIETRCPNSSSKNYSKDFREPLLEKRNVIKISSIMSIILDNINTDEIVSIHLIWLERLISLTLLSGFIIEC